MEKIEPRKFSGILYMGRPVEECSREELLSLVIGQDFVLARLIARWPVGWAFPENLLDTATCPPNVPGVRSDNLGS